MDGAVVARRVEGVRRGGVDVDGADVVGVAVGGEGLRFALDVGDHDGVVHGAGGEGTVGGVRDEAQAEDVVRVRGLDARDERGGGGVAVVGVDGGGPEAD